MALFGESRNDTTSRKPKPRWYKSWAWTALSFLAATGTGVLLLLELRLGPVLASLAGLGVYFLLAFLIPQSLSGRASEVGSADVEIGEEDPRVDLLVEAHQHIATLVAAQGEMPLEIGHIVHSLRKHARAILDEVTGHPQKLSHVLRFFTYYLPSTADLVKDRVKLAPHAGSARLAEIDQTLARLLEAFSGFQGAVLAPDLESVDLDVELLDQALTADLQDLKK
jgi:hypothetical protein